MLQEQALLYTGRRKFQKGNGAAYQAATKMGCLNEICAHMISRRTSWSMEMLHTESAKYASKQEFRIGNYAAYQAALARGLDIFCSHMKPQHMSWNFDNLYEIALQYNTRAEFQYGNRNAYTAALDKGLLNSVCTHMVTGIVTKWDAVAISTAAMEYPTRSAFFYGNGPAYKAAAKKNILDVVCAHMGTALGGFDKKKAATLYYVKFECPHGLPLYKIGITNRTTAARITGMRVSEAVTATIVKEFYFSDGREARALEKAYHTQFKEHQYQGEPIMHNGNRELFVIDVLGLDSLAN